jgi:hypothetical protein
MYKNCYHLSRNMLHGGRRRRRRAGCREVQSRSSLFNDFQHFSDGNRFVWKEKRGEVVSHQALEVTGIEGDSMESHEDPGEACGNSKGILRRL